MTKSVIVIDTPETCSECPLFEVEQYHGCRIGSDHWEEKPKLCPLRPLPRKLTEADISWGEQRGYRGGWNNCLAEITGETE